MLSTSYTKGVGGAADWTGERAPAAMAIGPCGVSGGLAITTSDWVGGGDGVDVDSVVVTEDGRTHTTKSVVQKSKAITQVHKARDQNSNKKQYQK